ncbi:alpha/beta fold hydrolase [Pseudomonas sp.]|uniref:alpha/beta fold hydrolase n=1 Tax=Pseudomonas sp. TaxID=306 RepID=UPI003CC611AE
MQPTDLPLTLSTADGASLAIHHWPAAGTATAQLIICHGMAEHGARYAALAEPLNANGISVQAMDLRGHGASTPELPRGVLAAGVDWSHLVDDVALLLKRTRAAHPNQPIVLLGHSMGSYLAQSVLIEHSALVDVAILSGSHAQPAAASAAAGLVARIEGLLRGPQAPAKTLDRLSFAQYNRTFAPNRTAFDWLSRDQQQVDRYVADPLCGFVLSCHYWRCLADALLAIGSPSKLAPIRSDLPLLIIGGDADPISAGGGLEKLQRRLRAAGLRQVELRLYPGARHELFNETNRAEVVYDLLAWLAPHLTALSQRSRTHANP